MIIKNTLILFTALLLFSSCDDAVIDPFKNEDKYFTIYGYLDELNTEHQVRVIPVTRRLTEVKDPDNPTAHLDVTVRSINLVTGQVTRWWHSLEELDDGTYGHIFRASFVITPGTRYRLEVERPDGKITYAETTIPKIDSAHLLELSEPFVSEDSSLIYQDIYIPSIPSPWDMQAIYLWESDVLRFRVLVPYGRPGERTEDGGWNVRLNLSEDQPVVKEFIRELREGRENRAPIYLPNFGLQIRILDTFWDPPEGVFDPNELSKPGVASNVVNGYGVWGGVGLFIEEWNTCEYSEALGYGSVWETIHTWGCER